MTHDIQMYGTTVLCIHNTRIMMCIVNEVSVICLYCGSIIMGVRWEEGKNLTSNLFT